MALHGHTASERAALKRKNSAFGRRTAAAARAKAPRKRTSRRRILPVGRKPRAR